MHRQKPWQGLSIGRAGRDGRISAGIMMSKPTIALLRGTMRKQWAPVHDPVSLVSDLAASQKQAGARRERCGVVRSATSRRVRGEMLPSIFGKR